ncbi:MAG: hypothetical protein AAF487_05120 [Bacteroidota bacterium]
MLRTIGLILLGIGLVTMSSGFTSLDKVPHDRDWERIGSKKVDFKIDKDVIIVGADEGRYKKLKIAVSGGSLNMHRMTVHYANGSKENIALKHNFKPATASRIIDLKGNSRVIKKITFIYDSKNRQARKAKIHVFGKH